MSGLSHDVLRWKDAFEDAARSLLDGRLRDPHGEYCQVSAAPCAKHGAECVCVTYGMFLEHFRWDRQDPRQLAERLVGTMVPSNP